MRLLLDTVTFLWILEDSEKLTETVRKALREPENILFLSAASAWEIALKHAVGKLALPQPPALMIPQQREGRGILALPIDEAATLHLGTLPRLHGDPFDRIIICQAIEHAMTVVTPDPLIAAYPIRVLI